MKSYGPPPRGYGVYDFLTDWGLRMASATPSGNVLQTGAKQAIEPHERLMAGKGEQEMADYMAGVSATGASLSAVADVAAAQAKASEFNKDYTKERRKEEMQQDIFTQAQPGSFGSTWSGAAGMAEGTVEINDLKKLLGNPNLPVDLITMRDTEGTGNFTFDPKALDDKKVWYDPNKKGWMIIVTTTDAEGKEGVATQYFNTFDKAYKNLGKTTTSKKPEQLETPVKEKEEKSLWKKITEGKTTEESDYTYKAEDFLPKPSTDAVELAIQKAESGSTEDYDEMTKFWNWVSSPKGDVKKRFEKELAEKPEQLR